MKNKEEQTAPKLRFKGYTDAWQQQKGSLIFKSKIEKGFPNLTVLSATQNKGMVPRNKIGVDIKTSRTSLESYKRIEPGDFVIHLRSFQGGFAYSGIEGIGSPAYTVFSFKAPENFNDNFWKEKFTSYNFIQSLKKVTYGVRDGRSISYSDFLTLNQKFPLKSEQDEIGKLLSKLDETITLLQRKKTKYEELKMALLQNLFPKKGQVVPILRFKNFQNDWQQSKLEDRLEINSGKDYKGLNKGKIPVYGTGGYMLSVDKSLSEKNAIGIGRKGTINKPQLLHAPFWTVDTLFYLTPKANNNLIFLFYLFQKINWSKYDESTGLPSLSKKTINNIKESTPSNSEQKKIGNLLSKIDTVITLLHNQLSNLENLKQFLLQNMFI